MITKEELDALIELALRAPKSKAEYLWLLGLVQRINQAAIVQPTEEERDE